MAATRTVIRPHHRDHQLSPIPVDFDPDTLGWLLDEGARGNLVLQNELFNTMEDTWERLRANLNKLKKAVCKLPFNLQPWTEKGREPNPSALEKATFVEHVLHNQKAATWEGQHNFEATIYELLDAVARGVSVLEIDWTVDNGKYVPIGTRRVPWTCLGFEPPSQLSGFSSQPSSNALRLFPDRDPNRSKAFASYPNKFLVGVYRAKSGHIAEGAQLRALAHLWLGRILGWEWMTHKAELFGLPIRWATYDPSAPQTQIDQVSDMLANMGTAAWGAFPAGTELQILNGSQPGVAGSAEPTERLMALADRACDLLFLGQTLTTEEGSAGSGSYALGNVHREVELDLYENYAGYVIDVINNQLIPSIVQLNWGEDTELPFLEVELNRPAKDKQLAERDKLLFHDMALPVSKQWLYDRHKVPAPGPSEDLYRPSPRGEPLEASGEVGPTPAKSSPPSQGGVTGLPGGGGSDHPASTIDHRGCVHAASESTESLHKRQRQSRGRLYDLLLKTDLTTHDLIWTGGDCPICAPFNGTAFGESWTSPPPLHHNCDCAIVVRAKP